MSEISLSADGSTITVFVPMAWRRRGGRKVIVAPPGCDDWAPPPRIDHTLVKALARAHRWQRMLESGEYGTLAELADAERISRSYVCRVLRLTLLAPDIVERILGRAADGRARPALGAVSGRVGAAARAVLNPLAGGLGACVRLRQRLYPCFCCWRPIKGHPTYATRLNCSNRVASRSRSGWCSP